VDQGFKWLLHGCARTVPFDPTSIGNGFFSVINNLV
jgi:hypothetical protein